MKKVLSACIVLLCAVQLQAQKSTMYTIEKTFHIASAGGWDYLAVNKNLLYVSHGTQVNILDKNSGDSVGVIPNTTGVHGIAFNNALGKGYTSNGRKNNVFVFDLKTNAVLDSIATGKNPDAIMYEPYSKKIITCNGSANNLTIIDPLTNKVVATIAVGGKPETAVSDEAGKLFVNIEDKSQIVEVNLNTYTLTATWPIAPGEEPTGLAYDKTTKRLFAGCDKQLIVLDALTGKLVTTLPIGEGCDGVAYDANAKTIFTSNGSDGTITVINTLGANKYMVAGTIASKKGARTITIDEATKKLYLPTADFEKNTPAGQWPKMIPGTFQVLVLSK